jgi:DNA ligase (NAD+)
MEDIGVPCRAKTVPAAAAAAAAAQKSLVGISVLFTGFRNKELEAEIEARGGKVASAISGKTSVVVAKNPDDSSGKVKAAKELGIPVVDEAAFRSKYL